VWKKYKSNKQFEKLIQKYTQSQLWNKPQTYEEIENLTHIALLMLISKLIFYKTYVDNQTWHRLSPMKVPDGINTPEKLEEVIWQYFEEFKEITGDFELLIGERADIIFQIPFVSEAVIDLVKDVLETGGHYNFSDIPFDIIGRIFEELIREDERHKLGQYFTPPHVIDLINSFVIHKGNSKVFDPSCGSGTFLVRAYERKKNLCKAEDKGSPHEILLNEIYGNDLSGYPAYLSMLNLAIRNTRRPSYPRISNKDFFAIGQNTNVVLHNQKGELEKKPLPKFDAIIGNPPYTRQEDIGTMHGTQTKDQIQGMIKSECGFNPSARTSIYAYFFYHASVFLKDEGYLGFIVQNSWLDTDYGADLQKYLLRNYEIIAIMDSEVERFFPSASVNTSIVILRRQKDEDVRDRNTVKFIYFTLPVADAIKQFKSTDRLYEEIINSNKNIANKYFKIICVKQNSLINYTKWGQFLKAPQVYFDIKKKGEGKFTPLGGKNGVAEVKYGIKTGNNDFFILKDVTENLKDSQLQAIVNIDEDINSIKQVKQFKLRIVENGFNELWLIESQFLKPILTSPKDVTSYVVKSNSVKYCLLVVDDEKKILRKDYPYVFKYIIYAERKDIHLGSTLASRKLWYDAGEKRLPDLSFSYMINDFGKTYSGKVFTNDNFQNIYVKKNANSVFLYLNSTISWLQQQLIIRTNFGDGVGKIQSYELADLEIIPVNLDNISVDLGETKNYKEELGSLESLKTVNPERVKLDSAILEAIGYKQKKEREEVLLELYRSTYQLIDARLKKAQSMKGVKAQRNKVEFSVYVDQLKTMLVEGKYLAKNTITFAKQIEKLVKEITAEKKLQSKILDAYWKEKFGELYNKKSIEQKNQISMF
uniref:HsdM family class I SAM-dependent methyltransferase n=1 Tax=uncultured Flavobacterium sp. TaxID=165435 RepID=UPI002601A87B